MQRHTKGINDLMFKNKIERKTFVELFWKLNSLIQNKMANFVTTVSNV